MSFLFRRQGSSDQANRPEDFERLRNQQLLSLSQSGARAINQEQNLFDLPVYLPSNQILFLRICLSDRFPFEAPSIMTTARAIHPWLNNQMQVIGHVDLNSWSRTSELGKIGPSDVLGFKLNQELLRETSMYTIVTEIALEFTRRPPTLDPSISIFPGQQQTQPHCQLSQNPNPPQPHHLLSQNHRTPAQVSSHHPNHQPVAVAQNPQIPPTQSPAIPHSFLELESMSCAELEVLLADKSTMKSHVRKNQTLVKFLKSHEELVKRNSDLANRNLEHQAEIQAHYDTIATLRETLEELNTQYTIKREQKQALAVHTQAATLLDRVREQVHVLDEESETIASGFTQGEINMRDFVHQYLSSRTAYHMHHDKLHRYDTQ